MTPMKAMSLTADQITALVDAVKIAQCEIKQAGTVDRELVLKRIHDALAEVGEV